MSDTRPDVLWLYCDELRADALGCYGSPRATPAADALAAAGVRFTASWCNSPVCVPSRTALHTGLLPELTGVFNNEAAATGYPMPDVITFPEVLARAGYRTLSVGKEHIPAALTPWQVDDHSGSAQRWVLPDVRARMTDTGRTALGAITGHVDGEFPPRLTTTTAVERLQAEEEGTEPLLFRASFLQPHTPVVVPTGYARPGAAPALDDPADARLSEFEVQFAAATADVTLSTAEEQIVRDNYADLVAWVDDQLGEVVAAFTTLRRDRPKIIVLTADHGANLGEGGTWGKHTFSPQSQRVPLIIVAPGQRPAVRDDLVQSIDLARTIMGLCGVDVLEQFTGRDLFADPEPEQVFATIGYGNPESRAYPNKNQGTFHGHGWPRRSCVRTRRYRLDLTTRLEGRPATTAEHDVFLADREADPREMHNLAGDPAYRDVQERLTAELLALADTAVELPAAQLADLFETYRRVKVAPVLVDEQSETRDEQPHPPDEAAGTPT